MTDGREAGALEAAWQRSDLLFGLIAEPALLARPIPLRQPFLFYLGHLPAFAWNHLGRGLGLPPLSREFDSLFERGIDPPDDAEDAPGDPPTAWPMLEQVLAYRDRARRELRGKLDDPRLRDALPMVVEHELMHHETLLYMLQELPAAAKRRPVEVLPPAPRGSARAVGVRIPAGRVALGAPRDGRFRWDNEHGPHVVDVPAFTIDALPVTNRDFRAFVDDGGYAERRLWSDDGWRWIRRRGARAPHGWRDRDGAWRVATPFGDAPFDDAADWPACVSHCEARAYATWRGARLPSEAEFQRAAYAASDGGSERPQPWGDEAPEPRHANLGLARWGLTPVGAHPDGASAFGVQDLVGNAWEWTGTLFHPFPGFEPMARYPGYSADFFDQRHFVLLGGSWATDARLARRSFRNWFQPHYPYVFAQFRCVTTA